MSSPEGLTPELQEAWENAWSTPGQPPGAYIGSVERAGEIFYFYQEGQKHWFETEYSRRKRKEQAEKKRQERQQAGYNGRKRRW